MKNKKTNPAVFALITVLCLLLIALLTLLIGYAAGVKLPGLSHTSGTGVQYPLIIIDAGHGGEDGGASGGDGVLEKDLNLDVSFILSDMLKAGGVPVIMTRTEDILLYDRNIDYKGRKKVLDLKVRLKISDDNPGALFVSIHMNAFPQKKYSGLQVYYSTNEPSSKLIAETIQDIVRNYLQPENLRQPKAAGSNIYLLHENENTAVLVECGFLSNDAECEKLADPAYRQQLTLALFCGIMEYLADSGSENAENP
jgi:N-acetylmuramoyl-L-alanine amidase